MLQCSAQDHVNSGFIFLGYLYQLRNDAMDLWVPF